MPAKSVFPAIPLPRAWPRRVQTAILNAIALAQFALVRARYWAVESLNPRLRQAAELDQAQQEIAFLTEQIRILHARMESILPQRRPYYPPVKRMAILELKAIRGWSLDQTAKAFLVTPATIASWMKRLDEEGPIALLQVPVPVNMFPELVRYLVQRLKTLCPAMGMAKIAQTLARAVLHLGTTTISRMLKQKPSHEPSTTMAAPLAEGRIVTAKYPGHVWHVDLTVVPTGGFWTTWQPFSLPQCCGVGRGVSPRPQPQTGRASFQASGFPDDSTLVFLSQFYDRDNAGTRSGCCPNRSPLRDWQSG